MNTKYIIWDYNGTMLDDVRLCVDTINEMLTERNCKPVTTENYKIEFDFPVQNYYARVGFDFTNESFDIVGEEFITRYNARQSELKLHAGIAELVSELHRLGFKQSVLSARKQTELRSELNDFGLAHFFEYISGLGDNLAAGKLQNGINLRKLLPFADNQILLIGDTLHDFHTAQAMGIQFIGLALGHHSVEKLRQSGCKIFDSTSELHAHLLSSNHA